MGVRQLVVVIFISGGKIKRVQEENKEEVKVNFQERVDRIEEELKIYLKKIGYRNATF